MESEKSYAYLERLKAALSPGLIALASLLLLGYVGLGETLRSYPALQHDRLVAQGEIIQKEVNTFLQAGLPLRQFVGFETLSSKIYNFTNEGQWELAANPSLLLVMLSFILVYFLNKRLDRNE